MTEFDQIYATYFHDVFLYIKSLSHDDSLAQEITSETFFKALGAIDKFRGDCDIQVWLCQIAKNCFYSYQKRAKRLTGFEDLDESKLKAPSFEEHLEDKTQAEKIQSILHELPDPYKEVFLWRVYAEMSFKEIGKLFGKTENWACVTYHRAKNKIKERLDKDE